MTEVHEFRHRHALAGTAETDAHEHTPPPAPQVDQPPPDRLALLAVRREETPVS